MADVPDRWYVRLPDGRVVRAKSTKSLRYHISSGRIPVKSRVRRSPAEEWTALEWTTEFADIVASAPIPAPAAPSAAPPAPAADAAQNRARAPEIKVLGAYGLMSELLNALDNTLNRTKLMPAAALGLVVGLGGAVYEGLVVQLEPPWSWSGEIGIGVCVLMGFCLVTAVITQITFVELSRLRPARAKDIRAGLTRHTLNLVLAHFLVGGFLLLILLTLWKLPLWLMSPEGPGLSEALLAPAIAVQLVWEVAFWPLFALMLLFGPIAIVEERSFAGIILEWWGMLRLHLGRLLLYETMALLLGLLVAAPFLLPVLLTALFSWGESGLLGIVRHSTLAILGGLALTPLVAYLLVANVYIYLNLRYEFSQAGR
jgi:hypothetical protein